MSQAHDKLVAELDKHIAQACTDAIAALLPPGEYPLDVAVVQKARNASLATVSKHLAAAEPEKSEHNTSCAGDRYCTCGAYGYNNGVEAYASARKELLNG